MNTQKSPSPSRDFDDLSSAQAWRHVVIWILLVVAALLLLGFTAVVDEMTQRGELRRANQNALGYLMLPEELASRVSDVLGLASIASDKLVGR